jgi:hypothetical protein
MYESPIEIIVNEIQNQIVADKENGIYKAISSYGINVNKDELIRALQYDRDQYNKGFEDGMECFAALLKDWFVKNSNYWFSHTVNAKIDQLLKERGYSIETTND